MTMLALLCVPIFILGISAVAAVQPAGLSGLNNAGPHGFSELLRIAGTLAAKRFVPATAGTLPTHGMQFVGLLVGTIVIVGGLTFFPTLALGPAAEYFAMQSGSSY